MRPGVQAAIDVAHQLGLHVDSPLLIQETNNTVVWLRPNPIIAKVGTRQDSALMLDHEHRVASALRAVGAPTATPLLGVPPMRDPESGFVVTLWDRLTKDPNMVVSGVEVGRSLGLVHEAMARIRVELPSVRICLERTRAALSDDARMAALATEDREFLRHALSDLMLRLEDHTFTEQGLHGEPHGGNLLTTPEGLRWIDFEDACRGPLEWDLAFLTEEGRGVFKNIDRPLLDLLTTLNSARVATWCWVQARFPEMRSHGEHHLAIVRSRWP
jgi:thiamine kinase-like enzyme